MARALKQAGSTPKEGGQYVNVLFVCLFVNPISADLGGSSKYSNEIFED